MNIKFTWKIWVLIIFLLFSVLSIFGFPPTFFKTGVFISSIESNSAAFDSGLRQGQIIIAVDGKEIKNLGDYANALSGKFDSNVSEKIILTTTNVEFILFENHPPEIIVSNIPKTN